MTESNTARALKTCLLNTQEIQNDLDLRSFQLKTLNDISKELFGSVDVEVILKNFLLMTMGNFGVLKGFVLLTPLDTADADHFVSVGFPDTEIGSLRSRCRECSFHGKPHRDSADRGGWLCRQVLPHGVKHTFPFVLEKSFQGFLGLGPRLVGESFEEGERELLETLINNLVVALKNARSFEKIWNLNRSLENKTIELQNTLQDLKAAVRKVELLESIKESLSKFVPITVSKMIETSPTGSMPDSKNQDVSVLFLDIEGYTRLCEKFDSTQVNRIVEQHFSVFMDAIHANNGDVNETAGDGLMVLFLNEDRRQNALDAVRTALTIQQDAERIGRQTDTLSRPLDIHMGIHSGRALVGATKFSSPTGSRWTYTARGMTVNLASRIGSLATGGTILMSKETAGRVADRHPSKSLGKFELKNVTGAVEVFQPI